MDIETAAALMDHRLHKLLEDTNLKLGAVVTDLVGVSARAMLQALLDGETDAATLAELAQGRLRAKRALLKQALVGILKAHHRFLVAEYLSHTDYLEEVLERFSAEIGALAGIGGGDCAAGHDPWGQPPGGGGCTGGSGRGHDALPQCGAPSRVGGAVSGQS